MLMTSYHLRSPDGLTQAVVIPEQGGFVSSLRFPFKAGQQEVLFLYDHAMDKNPHTLPGGIPFVFPVCARLSRNGIEGMYLYDGKQYQLKIHGFSWYASWDVVSHSEHHIELILKETDETLVIYPFQFEIRLRFSVMNKKLICEQTYCNKETKRPMPYYAGFHPYFLTPPLGAGKENTTVSFQSKRRLKYNPTLTDIVGDQPVIETPIAITDPSVNEQLSVLSEDKAVILTYPTGDQLKISAYGESDADLFSYLQLYHILEKPFFCIEHWMGFPNAMNSVSGVRWLAPNTSEKAVYEIDVL